MKELKPELKDLIKDIDEVTDFSDMKAAKVGGMAIKKALNRQIPETSSETKIKKAVEKINDLSDSSPETRIKRAEKKIDEAASRIKKATKKKVEVHHHHHTKEEAEAPEVTTQPLKTIEEVPVIRCGTSLFA
uniref:Uncharacterized protein n=1 Tax=Strombidium rassoulzadegani TaxID=1082188 RepID=A0A7S3CQQ6_9SPIT|mmetsp:Transcript_4207/g.7138  ORF Transcript_4207/g.7138 Transcript_4207/m.7138 type:complete len:132 (+) Transcript_4207:301-696(+)